jgi:hypothetical protein
VRSSNLVWYKLILSIWVIFPDFASLVLARPIKLAYSGVHGVKKHPFSGP